MFFNHFVILCSLFSIHISVNWAQYENFGGYDNYQSLESVPIGK